jgi:hypothetical protein
MDDHRKNYRLWDAEQNCHGAVSPREALPQDDLVFFLIDLIPQIDLRQPAENDLPESGRFW